MPEIQAFRAIRYDLGHVGNLSDVVAPPYDVISPDLQERLYQRHPCNVVRLILNRIEPGDDDEVNNRYTRARRFLKTWRREGVLFTEADPALYVYHQEFDFAGIHAVRRGFMGRVRATRFGEGPIFPHEETMSGPKADRLMLTALCKANLSQVFGLYPDSECEAQTILENAAAGQTPLVATDQDGVTHRMWPVTDVEAIAAVAAVMGPKPMFIADGHHRYETACNYREQVYDSGFLSPEHPANFVLMHCVAMEDPGLAVLPTHRLFRGLPELAEESLTAKLGTYFDVRPVTRGPDAAHEVWEEIETADDQSTLGFYTAYDGRWLLATLTAAGRRRMDEVAEEHREEWRELGVSILHRLVVEDLLEARDLPKPEYVHLVEDVVAGAASGEFPLAALVMPATVEQVKRISLAGERMPAKSTYFYPKLLSGLVFNPLE